MNEFENLMNNIYKDSLAVPFYRGKTLVNMLEKVPKHMGMFGNKFVDKSPIKKVSLRYLIEFVRAKISVFNKDPEAKNFDYKGLTEDLKYLIDCLTVFFGYQFRKLGEVRVDNGSRGSNETVLSQLLLNYKTMMKFMLKVIKFNLAERPLVSEIAQVFDKSHKNALKFMETWYGRGERLRLRLI